MLEGDSGSSSDVGSAPSGYVSGVSKIRGGGNIATGGPYSVV